MTTLLMAAAGESRRYRSAGIETPKALLRVRWHGVTKRMVEHAMEPYAHVGYWIAGLPESVIGIADFCKVVEKSDSHVRTVRSLLDDDNLVDDEIVLVADCDVLLGSGDIDRLISKLRVASVAVAVGAAAGPGFSYADRAPWATRFSESDGSSVGLPVVGLRGFRRAGDLRWALEEGARTMTEAVNMLSPPYAAVVVEHWTDWGTPEALAASGAEIVP